MEVAVTARPDDRGQSEVVGEILAIGVVVVVVSVVGAYLLGDVASPNGETLADVTLSVGEERIELANAGGGSVATTDLELTVYVNGTRSGITWASGTVEDDDGDARFDPGERWIRDGLTLTTETTVRVTLADTDTGTLLLDRTVSPGDRR
jgi:hypothetical protein